MAWQLRNDLPIYSQLVEHMTIAIITGKYAPGEKLPSVRDAAAEAGVNPNTMQRALSELERDGLIFTRRTSGRFVTDDTQMIGRAKLSLAENQIQSFLGAMSQLGYTKDDVLTLLQDKLKGGENEHACF